MAYEKHTWETGEVITAAKLNNIEDGVSSGGGYDAVIAAFHDDSSTYWQSGWEFSVVSGSFNNVTAKLDSGTIAPRVLVLIKDLYIGVYASVDGAINYYDPNVSVPYFDVYAMWVCSGSKANNMTSINPYTYVLSFAWNAEDVFEVIYNG